MTVEWADGIVTKRDYWIAQLRSAVRFADGVRTIADPDGAVEERRPVSGLGLGNTLTTFVGRTAGNNGKPPSCFHFLFLARRTVDRIRK